MNGTATTANDSVYWLDTWWGPIVIFALLWIGDFLIEYATERYGQHLVYEHLRGGGKSSIGLKLMALNLRFNVTRTRIEVSESFRFMMQSNHNLLAWMQNHDKTGQYLPAGHASNRAKGTGVMTAHRSGQK